MGRKAINFGLFAMTPENKRRLVAAIAPMTGEYSISIEPRRATRSQRANAYYFACVATPFAEFLSEGDCRKYGRDEAHWLIKAAVLPPVNAVDPRTGEVIGQVPANTHTMDVEQFMDFVERARAWLSGTFDLITPEPDPEYATKREMVQ